MKTLGVIPSRYESTRFPGKPLIDLKGKTMIQRVYEGAKKCVDLDHVVVATDDERIFNHVRSFGGEVMMTATTHQSGTDRCAEVSAKLNRFDLVVNIQGDEPLVNAEQLSQLIRAFSKQDVEIATLGIETNNWSEVENPNRIKVVCNQFDQALYFSRSVIPYGEKEANFPYLRHIGLYAYRAQVLSNLASLSPVILEKKESLEQLRWLYYGYNIHLIKTKIETPNIDIPYDVEKVLSLL